MTIKPIKVAVAKETKDALVGVTLRQDSDEDILINTIEPNSLFANTRLKPGMEVLKINGVSTDCLSLAQAMKMLRNAEDVVTIEACSIVKESFKNTRQTTAVPVASAPYRPDHSSEPPIYESSQEPTLIFPSSADGNEVIAYSASASATPSNLRDIPVASAEIMVDSYSTRSAITVDAAPVVAAYPASSGSAVAYGNSSAGAGGVSRDVIDQNGTVTVTANKPYPDTRTGLGLRTKAGVGVVITSFKTYSIFNGTNLKVGMQILRANGQDCSTKSAEYVAALLRSTGGDITIVARDASSEMMETGGVMLQTDLPLVTVHATKPNQQTKVGIGVEGRPLGNGTTGPVISSIRPNGLLAHTSLEVGMRVLSINGVSCRDQHDTVDMLRMAQGTLSIMAGPLRMVAATVTKATVDTKVGLGMRKQRGVVVVSGLPAGGLFAETALKEGMRVLQVNGELVDNLQLDEVLSIIASSEGAVTVLAEDVTTGAATATALENVPPPGVPAGGHWGTGDFVGPTNSLCFCILCALCGIFGMCTLCCKMDRAVMYRAPNGRVYDAKGRVQGSESDVRFRHNPPGVSGPQKLPESEIERSCGPNYAQKLMGCGITIFVALLVLSLVLRGYAAAREDSYSYSSSSCDYKYCYEWTTCYNYGKSSAMSSIRYCTF